MAGEAITLSDINNVGVGFEFLNFYGNATLELVTRGVASSDLPKIL